MDRQEVTMAYSKATKNTHVYEAVPEAGAPAMRSAYLEKWATGTTPPPRILVTVQAAPSTT